MKTNPVYGAKLMLTLIKLFRESVGKTFLISELNDLLITDKSALTEFDIKNQRQRIRRSLLMLEQENCIKIERKITRLNTTYWEISPIIENL